MILRKNIKVFKMKYIKTFITTILIFFLFSMNSFSQQGDLDLGKRYIKLAHTYIMSNDYKNANDFLNRGIGLVSKYGSFEGKYWRAVGLEYYGYLFINMGMNDFAKEKLREARDIYDQIIDQPDGSPYAIQKAIDRIDGINSGEGNYDGLNLPVTGSNDKVKNWGNMMLEKLPEEVYQLDCVQNIILSDNYLSDFPMGLGKFSDCLEYLDLSNNFIEELPYNIDEFSKLRFLDLSNNNIMELDNRICKLENLRFLNLEGNRIPFEEITNLIRCMPNTNIKFDKYEKVDEEEDMFEDFD